MTWIPRAAPKPKSPKRPRKPLCRSGRIKPRGKRWKKSHGALFWKRKDRAYRLWIRTENPCLLAWRLLRKPVSIHDAPGEYLNHNNATYHGGWWHSCWGEITPAHVGEHQSKGAPDFGVIVPLCKAAHTFYDNKRWAWAKATGFTEKRMASAASGYALKYVEQGGEPVAA